MDEPEGDDHQPVVAVNTVSVSSPQTVTVYEKDLSTEESVTEGFLFSPEVVDQQDIEKKLNPVPLAPKINGNVPPDSEVCGDEDVLQERLSKYGLEEYKIIGDVPIVGRSIVSKPKRSPESAGSSHRAAEIETRTL